MVPAAFDRARISRFLDRAAQALEGEWLLVGGAAASVWFKDGRVTEDIDIIGFAGTAAERLQLMEFAAKQGLPVEAVNSAADFFVHRIPDWKDQIEVLRQGPRATIYRPSATLFLLLKIARLSEQDLGDCLDLLSYAAREGVPVDRARLSSALGCLPATADSRLAARRAQLQSVLARRHGQGRR